MKYAATLFSELRRNGVFKKIGVKYFLSFPYIFDHRNKNFPKSGLSQLSYKNVLNLQV